MPFDLDCADRDWRRDYAPEELEALERRSRELARQGRPGAAQKRAPRADSDE